MVIFEPKKIDKRDKRGVHLKEGDIIAEGENGELIWDGTAKIIMRPLGIVRFHGKHSNSKKVIPKESDYYYIEEIRTGEMFIYNDSPDYVREYSMDSQKRSKLHLSMKDGVFCGWDDVIKVGSIYNFE